MMSASASTSWGARCTRMCRCRPAAESRAHCGYAADVDSARGVAFVGGPVILLVHGYPRTGSTWHRVAPRLVAEGFTVVCPDMRGYGQSGKAPILADHAQQSKRTVALDLIRLMSALGHPRFVVAGHGRGCCVALRTAPDHPDRVTRRGSWTVYRSTRPWLGATRGARTTGTTGSCSRSRTSRNGPSWPTRMPGTTPCETSSGDDRVDRLLESGRLGRATGRLLAHLEQFARRVPAVACARGRRVPGGTSPAPPRCGA